MKERAGREFGLSSSQNSDSFSFKTGLTLLIRCRRSKPKEEKEVVRL